MYSCELPVEVVAYLERLEYEMNGLRNLVAFCERSGQADDVFGRVLKRYQAAFCERNIALEEVRVQYVPEEYRTQEYRFKIDYPECRLEVEHV